MNIRDASNQDLLSLYFEQAQNGDKSEEIEIEIIRRMGTREERGDAIDSRAMSVDEGAKMIGTAPPPFGVAIHVDGNVGKTGDGLNLLVTCNLACSMRADWFRDLSMEGMEILQVEIATHTVGVFSNLIMEESPAMRQLRDGVPNTH